MTTATREQVLACKREDDVYALFGHTRSKFQRSLTVFAPVYAIVVALALSIILQLAGVPDRRGSALTLAAIPAVIIVAGTIWLLERRAHKTRQADPAFDAALTLWRATRDRQEAEAELRTSEERLRAAEERAKQDGLGAA